GLHLESFEPARRSGTLGTGASTTGHAPSGRHSTGRRAPNRNRMSTPKLQQKPAPGSEVELALYEIRNKVYPRAVTGVFARWRWALVWFTQLLFYGLPWLTWGDRPMVLFDLEARRFFL